MRVLVLALLFSVIFFGKEAQSQNVNYFSEIRLLVEEKCVRCHNKDSLSFPLDTYEALYQFRHPATDAIYSRRMPPWLAAPGHRKYQNDFSLTEEEIALWRKWETGGFKLGEPSSWHRIKKTPDPGLNPDLVLDIINPKRPYKTDVDKNDEYRCFMAKWPLKQKKFITWASFKTEQLSKIHHAAFFIVRPDVVPFFESLLATLDRNELYKRKSNTYSCFGSWMPDAFFGDLDEIDSKPKKKQLLLQLAYNSHLLLPWAPGYEGFQMSGDNQGYTSGIPILPGSLVIAQVHISNLLKPDEPVSSGKLSFLLEKEVDSPGSVVITSKESWYFGRKNNQLFVPPKSKGGVSTRNNLKEIYRVLKKSIGEGKEYAGLRMYGAGLHMHNFGESAKGVLVDSSEKTAEVLLEIPRWDFNWQLGYTFENPISFKESELLQKNIDLSCNYYNPNDFPIYGGYGTIDEMCQFFGFYSLIPLEKGN